MKRILVLAAGLASSTLVGWTPSAWAKGDRWYVEGGYHHAYVLTEISSTNVAVGLAGLDVGFNLGYGFSVEAMVAKGIVDNEVTYPFAWRPTPVRAGTWHGIAGKYSYSIGEQATLYTKLRMTLFDGNGYSGPGSRLGGRWRPGAGIGGTYDFSQKVKGIPDQVYGFFEYNFYLQGIHGAFAGIGIRF